MDMFRRGGSLGADDSVFCRLVSLLAFLGRVCASRGENCLCCVPGGF